METAIPNQLLPSTMACVKAIPVPDSLQKVDELFLFWLSESSTQELLRKELSKVCGGSGGVREFEEDTPVQIQLSSSSVTNVRRPGSPTVRTPSPPPLLTRSPKSPRTKPKPKSPRGAISSLTHVNAGRAGVATGDKEVEEGSSSSHLRAVEEVDVPQSEGQEDQGESQVQDDAPASPSSAKQPVLDRADADYLERQGVSTNTKIPKSQHFPVPLVSA